MEEVNCIVLDALKEHESICILGDIPTEKLHSEDYLASIQETISTFISFWNLNDKANLRLLAPEVWLRHTYFALGFNNDKYDFDNAHVQVIVLPVCLLRLSRRRDHWKIFRHKPQDLSLARRIAVLHEGSGQDPTPFLEDHITGVVHYNPRRRKPLAGSLESDSGGANGFDCDLFVVLARAMALVALCGIKGKPCY